MARARFVSRAIEGTKVTALCLDTTTDTSVTKEVAIAGVFKDTDSAKAKLEKLVRESIEKESEGKVFLVKIIATEKTSKLYGMPEAEFMSKAVVLDPVTRKPIDEQ